MEQKSREILISTISFNPITGDTDQIWMGSGNRSRLNGTVSRKLKQTGDQERLESVGESVEYFPSQSQRDSSPMELKSG